MTCNKDSVSYHKLNFFTAKQNINFQAFSIYVYVHTRV